MANLIDDRETPFQENIISRSESNNYFYGQRVNETPFRDKLKEKEALESRMDEKTSDKSNLNDKLNEINNNNEVITEQDAEKAKLKETIKSVLKFIISNLGLFIILIGYTSMGAWMFQVLEQENELTNCYEGKAIETANVINLKATLINYIKNNISLSAADTSKDNETVANANIEQLLQDFRAQVLNIKGSNYYTGQNCQPDTSVWNFPNALLFTITIVTTIGYGQISPKTTKGQIVCICYATIGIPIFLMCCSNISSIFSRMFRFVYSRICCGICYLKNKKKAQQAKQQKLEEKRLEREKMNGASNHMNDKLANANNPAQVVDDPVEEEEEEEKVSVPLTITIIFIGMYIFAGAYLFNYFENWSIITAAYFCYITLSTIGFGDYVPGQNMSDPNRNTNLIFGAVYIFFGLAILAMCFDLMQEEIIAKFTWLGTKLGVVNKEDDDEEEDMPEQELPVEQNKEEMKDEIAKENNINNSMANQDKNEVNQTKYVSNEKLTTPLSSQRPRSIEENSMANQIIRSNTIKRETPRLN